jgi:NAD(P)-dependent dehydrogenase (short-subunit alcohol dehydrogenase family)
MLEGASPLGKFQAKVAIVTGGGSGIGRATAQLFAREGAQLVLADMNLGSANETADAIARDGGAALAVECDISCETDVQRLMSASLERFGRIDVLVNSAARFLMKGGAEASEQDWHDVLGTNVGGTALCSRYVALQMKQTGGGAIVIVSSTSGMKADADYATYSTSKAALLMLTRSLAIDFGLWNIRVNSVSPGAVNTPALRRQLEEMNTSQDEFVARMFQAQCLRRFLQPDDIAHCILFLASDDAQGVTGANLVVDAGYCA